MKKNDADYVVGLEIGSSKVVVVIGQILYDGVINVIGIGSCPAKGIDKGNIIDLMEVVTSIRRAVEEAESIADVKIMEVTLAITGEHIKSFNEEGAVPISTGEVTQEDIDAAMHIAQSVKLPEGLELLHAIPQGYGVDKQTNIKNPLGLQGVRLKAKAHLITCHRDWLRNIKKAVEMSRLTVNEIVFSGLASSYSVLTEDEKDLGVCLVDIGGGTIDMAVFINGSLYSTKVIKYAGNIVTNDIASFFGTPRHDAEMLKMMYGSAHYPPLDSPNKQIETPSIGGHGNYQLSKEVLAQVISARYDELLTLVKKELDNIRAELVQEKISSDIIGGVVLTGGGAQIEDITTCGVKVFGMRVRVGCPINITGLVEFVNKPQYATVIGLLHNYYYNSNQEINNSNKIVNKVGFISRAIKKIFNYFKSEF